MHARKRESGVAMFVDFREFWDIGAHDWLL